MNFGKRQIVMAALVAALGTAVYLNWQFSPASTVTDGQEESLPEKQLGQTMYVNTELSASELTAASSAGPATTGEEGRFASEREQRRREYAQATEGLAEIVEAASSSETARTEAAAAAERLAQVLKEQADLEALLRTKGFDDALVLINENQCAVSLFGGTADDAAAIMIKDMVHRQAGIDFDKITISTSE